MASDDVNQYGKAPKGESAAARKARQKKYYTRQREIDESKASKGDRGALSEAEKIYKKKYGNAKDIGTYNKKTSDLSEKYAKATGAHEQARKEGAAVGAGMASSLIPGPEGLIGKFAGPALKSGANMAKGALKGLGSWAKGAGRTGTEAAEGAAKGAAKGKGIGKTAVNTTPEGSKIKSGVVASKDKARGFTGNMPKNASRESGMAEGKVTAVKKPAKPAPPKPEPIKDGPIMPGKQPASEAASSAGSQTRTVKGKMPAKQALNQATDKTPSVASAGKRVGGTPSAKPAEVKQAVKAPKAAKEGMPDHSKAFHDAPKGSPERKEAWSKMTPDQRKEYQTWRDGAKKRGPGRPKGSTKQKAQAAPKADGTKPAAPASEDKPIDALHQIYKNRDTARFNELSKEDKSTFLKRYTEPHQSGKGYVWKKDVAEPGAAPAAAPKTAPKAEAKPAAEAPAKPKGGYVRQKIAAKKAAAAPKPDEDGDKTVMPTNF